MSASAPTSRPRILIVQHDPVASGALAFQLRAAGFAAVSAGSLEDALDAASLGTPDVLVVEVALGEAPREALDGLSLAEALAGLATRLVLVAARAPDRELTLMALALGASDLMVGAADAERITWLARETPARPIGSGGTTGAPGAPASGFRLGGSLRAWGVERLAGLAERHRLDATLTVEAPGGVRTLGIRDGRVVQASGPEGQGAPAALGALREREGSWRLDGLEPDAAGRLGPDAIRRPLAQLVAEARGEEGAVSGGSVIGPRSARARLRTDPGGERRIRRQVGIPATSTWASAPEAAPADRDRSKGPERPRPSLTSPIDDRDPPTIPDIVAIPDSLPRPDTWREEVTPARPGPGGSRRALGPTLTPTREGLPRRARGIATRTLPIEAAPEPVPALREAPASGDLAAPPTPSPASKTPVPEATAEPLDLRASDGRPRRRLLTRSKVAALEAAENLEEALAATAAALVTPPPPSEPEPEPEPAPVAAPVTESFGAPVAPDPDPAPADVAELVMATATAPAPMPEPPVPSSSPSPAGARAQLGVGSTTTVPPAARPARLTRQRGLRVAVAALLVAQVAVGGALAWWYLTQPAAQPLAQSAPPATAAPPAGPCGDIAHAAEAAPEVWETRARACLAVEPSNPVALARLGVALYERDALDEAQAVFLALKAAVPTEASLDRRVGWTLLASGDAEGAREAFERFAAVAPPDDPERLRMSRLAEAAEAP